MDPARPDTAPPSSVPNGPSSSDSRSAADRQKIWNLPNQLTIARLLLSVVFFILLAIENHTKTFQTGTAGRINLILNVSLFVFVLAVVTDFLDGYLARKWNLVSTFGRIADPFADKVVVCGAFVMLTSVTPRLVEPWFAVVIMTREFLVSGLRSFLESRGVAFGASWSGKFKMLVQSITIPLVLFYQANLASVSEDASWRWAADAFYWLTIFALALTLITTITSSFDYIRRAIKLFRAGAGSEPEA